jgi:hypothetical protein
MNGFAADAIQLDDVELRALNEAFPPGTAAGERYPGALQQQGRR